MQYAAFTGTMGLCCHLGAGTLSISVSSCLSGRERTSQKSPSALRLTLTYIFSMSLLLSVAAAWLASCTFAATVLPRQNNTDYKLGSTPLDTPWTNTVGTNPWPEYPRPRLQRSHWKNLNGVWRYRNGTEDDINSPPFGQRLEDPVLVPFCLESALSGISTWNHFLMYTAHSYYRSHW
jgi:hypothetical protein